MSKRHRKTKEFIKDREAASAMSLDDWYEAPKGKKPRGRERRKLEKYEFYTF